jgi:hypothetical protein
LGKKNRDRERCFKWNLDPGAKGSGSTKEDPFVFDERRKRYV